MNASGGENVPRFTVVTVCLNAREYLARAAESVLLQDYPDFEYLVVDGGSTDGTQELLRSLEPRFGGRLRWLSEPDRGLYDAMNKGISLARGEYVQFLGADDELEPSALSHVASTLSSDIDIVCGTTRVLSPAACWLESPKVVLRRGLPARAPSRHQSIFVRREAIVAVGGFDTAYRIAADYDLYLRLKESGATEIFVPETLSTFRLGGESSRSAIATAGEYRTIRVAHGASPVVESLVMLKSVTATVVFGVWARLARRRAEHDECSVAGGGAAASASRGDRRPRILVVNLGRRGGVTTYGQLMAEALASQVPVAAITASGAENRATWGAFDGPHLEVETFSGITSMLASFIAIGRFRRISSFARSFGPDVIYYPGGHAWKPLLDLLLPRVPVVLTVHDPQLHAGEDSLLHRLLAASNRIRVAGYVLLNTSQSEEFARRLRLAPDRVAIIPHGIFNDLLAHQAPLDEIPGFESVARLGRYALFVGRIQRYKGVDTLLKAYRSLPRTQRMPLVIAGAGNFTAEESSMLEALGDDVTVVHRWMSDTELASLVSAARFVVLPYRSATQSGVIPLASAFGVPAVASNAGGIAEQVLDGETGFLFPAGDDRRLAETLTKAFALPDVEYRRMSEECRRRAETEWAWDRLAGRLLEFIETLVAQL